MSFETDVLVVGAGPIGLINALGMKRLNPELNITVLEKYEEYQRSHTLDMLAKHLEAVMKASNSEDDPALIKLLTKLKKDRFIRTNALQKEFTKLAKDSGVEIKTKHEVKADTIAQLIEEEYPNISLVIGADGTHSVVSQALYPEGNQVKHEFDFVLQLRFEVMGEEKAPGIATQEFYQQMARKGLIANEYVGHFDKETGKTPITMQVMISKKDFLALHQWTSKNPGRPYIKTLQSSNEAESSNNMQEIPKSLNAFINSYLQRKIRDTKETGQQLDRESIRISVNEAPATHAKKIVNKQGDVRVVLLGDAALGLSYFKGLNAGMEASARFLTTMASTIKDGFNDKKLMDKQLNRYQNWFLCDFSPKKVKEVASYSFWQIRSFMNAMKAVRGLKEVCIADDDYNIDKVIIDYFDHCTNEHTPKTSGKNWRPYPHRNYDLVKMGQFAYVPLQHTAKKIAKTFVDYFKPYKSGAQISQDFKQPLIGGVNLFVGLVKVFAGLFTLHPKLAVDGLFSMLRGIIECATTPVAWLLKPLMRGLATLIHGGYKKIEESNGLKNLAQYGHNMLDSVEEEALQEEQTIYQLLAVCNDMHRKVNKSLDRGQKTNLGADEEGFYSEVRADSDNLDPQKLRRYFSLFAPVKNASEQERNSAYNYASTL